MKSFFFKRSLAIACQIWCQHFFWNCQKKVTPKSLHQRYFWVAHSSVSADVITLLFSRSSNKCSSRWEDNNSTRCWCTTPRASVPRSLGTWPRGASGASPSNNSHNRTPSSRGVISAYWTHCHLKFCNTRTVNARLSNTLDWRIK